MSVKTTIAELRNMPINDLEREVRAQRMLVTKLSINVRFQKEKNSAKYKREKKRLAQVMTIISEKKNIEPTSVTTKA